MRYIFSSLQFFAIGISVLSCSTPKEQTTGETYVGEIIGAKRGVSIEITINADQKKATLNSSLGLSGMAVTLVQFSEDSLIFAIPSYNVSYRGKLSSDRKTISGVWNQGVNSHDLSFILKERSPLEKVAPPSTDFEEKEVTIEVNRGIRLAGTLTIPSGNGSYPAVILLGVAGKTDRDQSFGPFKPFKLIAERLTKSGFVVLRCDDRGVGKSSGSLYESSYDDLIGDAQAMISYLRQIPQIDSTKVGVLGISEGAALGGILAATSNTDFAILLSYPALPGVKTIRQQIHNLSAIYNFAESQEKLLISDFEVTSELILKSNNSKTLKDDIKKHLKNLNPAVKELTQYLFIPQDLEEASQLYCGAWYRSQLSYDPTLSLPKISCPLLILYGNQDPFVDPNSNIAQLKQELRSNSNTKIEIQIMDSINHIFQDAATGSPFDYSNNNNAFSTKALNKIEGWLIKNIVSN